MSGRRVIASDIVETAIRALRRTLAREHAGRIFLLAPIRIHGRRVRIRAGQIFVEDERQDLAPIDGTRHGDLRNLAARQRDRVVVAGHVAVADLVREFLLRDGLEALRPGFQLADCVRTHGVQLGVIGGAQFAVGRIGRGVGQRRFRITIQR
jgi:hypothetical protein